jgi:predicted Fe-Mo cluster-binding NifX family protein
MEQRIAVPVVNGLLSAHFGHCEFFFIADVVNGEVRQTKEVVPPPHEPGVIPRWLSEEGVNVVLVGGIGQKAVDLFNQFGVKPVIGVPAKAPKELVDEFLADKLVAGVNQCSH